MPASDLHPGRQSDIAEQTEEVQALWQRVIGRRSFLKRGAAIGAAAVPLSMLASSSARGASTTLSEGDAAILRFLAAAELLETDLWIQYEELGGLQGGNTYFGPNLELSSVPEPSSLVLCLVAGSIVTSLGAWRRRRMAV